MNVFLKIPRKDDHREAEYLAQAAHICQPASLSNGKPNVDLQRLRVGAKSGVKSAEVWLGAYYESVKPKSEMDYTKEKYWWEKAAAHGDARAKKYLKTYAHIQYEQRDENSGSFQSLSEAQQHNAYAMTSTEAKQLEKAASNGNATDLSKLAAAAKSGDAKAQLALGFYWFTKKDYATSNQWWGKAATQGNVKAETVLGLDRTLGLGAPKDYVRANYWFEKAASQGSANAEFNLGLAYFHGYGVPKNYAKANYWYRKASAQGFALAENNLGLAYLYGYGVPQNYFIAVYWYEKAAAQGNAAGENNLGVAYYRGHGVPQNTMTAISWWKKAAAQGGRAGMMAQHAISIAERG